MDRRRNDLQPGGASMLHAVILSVLAIIVVLAATACTVTTIAPTWVTMKLIEKEAVTAEEVVDQVDRVRTLLDTGITLAELGTEVRERIGYQHMMPSDRLLVDALLADVADRININVALPLSDEHITAIHRVLDQISRYAVMY